MPKPDYQGVIGDDWRTSTPWWPEPTRPTEPVPNVMLVVLDDVGFAQLGCYGSDLTTPTLDGLASQGVRFTNFHTTGLCSPTRSCLLTGRNHHRNGMGRISDLTMGYPGYDGEIPEENGFLSEVLGQEGYATYAVGKWHLTPDEQTGMDAPRRSWPLGRGFDRWYGFHGGETHQFVPSLYHDNHSVAPPASFEDGYHLSADLADQAISQIADLRAIDPSRPFFMYFATGACHSPHHAPTDWIERERGRFDQGWDAWREETFARQMEMGILPATAELPPRPPWVPAWEDLSDDAKRVAARFMECFAAFLSYTDAQIGRVLDFLTETGDRENTLVIVVSDNGASAEGGAGGSINDTRIHNVDFTGTDELVARIDELGGPSAHNNYPWGWTMAGNTPFRRWKREVHEGGVADPCIVAWPARISAGADRDGGGGSGGRASEVDGGDAGGGGIGGRASEVDGGDAGGGGVGGRASEVDGVGDVGAGAIRHQFIHAVDIWPTVLELAGVAPPDKVGYVPQTPVDGISFSRLLDRDGADHAATRTTQYFEMLGSRAIYHDGWKAVTFKPVAPLYDDGISPNLDFADDRWELYRVAEDPTEVHDLATQRPELVTEMVQRWWDEARRNQVLPLDNRVLHTILNPKPDWRGQPMTATYYPHVSPVPESVALDVKNRGHRIEVDTTILPGDPAEGVLLAQGSVLGGYSLQLKAGHLRYVHNLYGRRLDVIEAPIPVEAGRHLLGFEFERDDTRGGPVRLTVDGEVVHEGRLRSFTVVQFNLTNTGVTCGYEMGPAVGDDYEAPFRCTAQIRRATVILDEWVPPDPLLEFERILTEQ